MPIENPPSAGVIDGQQLFDNSHNLFADAGARQLFAPDGLTPWIDLSGDWINFPVELDVAGGAVVLANDGHANFLDGAISIGNDSGSAGSWDASGNLVAAGGLVQLLVDSSSRGVVRADSYQDGAGFPPYFADGISWIDGGVDGSGHLIAATILADSSNSNPFNVASNAGGSGGLGYNTTDGIFYGNDFNNNGQTFLSLFDGSAGNVSYAQYTSFSGSDFNTFFGFQGQTSSGLSNVFLQTDGDGSLLTGVDDSTLGGIQIATYGSFYIKPSSTDTQWASQDNGTYFDNSGFFGEGAVRADTGWTANSDAGDKTAVIGSTATLDSIATALNLVTAGAGTQLENIAQKVKALESALASQLRPNA